jgi:peptide/nickel transport system ATP-binding protein
VTSSPVLDVRDLRVTRGTGATIVDGVSLSVHEGETVAIVGESGSGKSITARAIMGLLPPGLHSSGTVDFRGDNLLEATERSWRRVRGRRLGLLFQDPFTMLNPLMRCGGHIADTLDACAGKRRMSRTARRAEVARRLAEVGIGDPAVADRYPFQLSGGMRQRVGIAAALAGDPDVLIADEPTTALDVTTQLEILRLLRRLQAARGMGLVLITHDLRVAFSTASRVYVFYAGSVMEVGPSKALEAEPFHPYSLGLLLSEPPSDRQVAKLSVVQGSVPQPDDVAAMCAFAPRCRWSTSACTAARPSLEERDHRRTACLRLDAIRSEMRLERAAHSAGVPGRSLGRVTSPLVVVSDLVKDFPSRRGHTVSRAVDQVCIEVGIGESVGIVGESGSGKTTLARCLVGLERPTGGRVVVGGIDATDHGALTRHELAQVRRTVQMVFQDPYSSLNPARTIEASLREALELHESGRGRGHLVEELLARVGLPAAYAARKPIALSGGERQRVALARALAVEPQLIVCDEAVSALDVSVQAQILNLLAELRAERGLSYLFISHDLAVVRQVVDRAYVLLGGKVVEEGPIDRLLDAPQHPYTQRLVASIPRVGPDWLAEGTASSVAS